MWVLECTCIAVDQWYGHAADPASLAASPVLIPAYCLPIGVLMAAWWAAELSRGAPARPDRSRPEIVLHLTPNW